MTQDDFQEVWKAAEGITAARLTQVTVSMSDVEAILKQSQDAAPVAVRPVLARAVAAGRLAFTTWFNAFYKKGAYSSERAGYRPILAVMIRRLLFGSLAAGEHPTLAYAKTQIDSVKDAWQMAGERFEQRNPQS